VQRRRKRDFPPSHHGNGGIVLVQEQLDYLRNRTLGMDCGDAKHNGAAGRWPVGALAASSLKWSFSRPRRLRQSHAAKRLRIPNSYQL